MSFDAWVSVSVLAVAVTLFISRAIPLAATAIGIPIVFAAAGVLTPEQCLSGFGNQAAIALGAIFVLGAGLQESGVATLIAGGLERVGGKSPVRTITVIMIVAAAMSAFMSNTATVAVMLPAVALLSRRTGIAISRLMMPLAFAAIMGGTLTLVGTAPNLILGEALRLRTGTGLGMFEFAEVGVPVTGLGILFMALVGWRMLPEHGPKERHGGAQLAEELARSYGFTQNLFRFRVPEGASAADQTIAELGVGSEYDLEVVLLIRRGTVRRRAVHPQPDLVVAVGDDLYVEGDVENVERMAEEQGLEFHRAESGELERIFAQGVTLAEVTIAPRSGALGKTFRELEFRRRYGLNVISIWRRDRSITSGTGDMPLLLGDAFLVSGSPARIQELSADDDFVVLGNGVAAGEDVRRAPLAIAILALALLPPLLGVMPLAISALAGALLMILSKCLTVASARHAIDVTVLILIVGTIPLGLALDKSGLATELAALVLRMHDSMGAAGLIAALYATSALLSTTSNNAAAAVILAPVAAQVAAAAPDLEPSRAFLAVAFGASCAFILPFAHQCNLIVMGPAGYSTRDFIRVGSLMAVLMGVATVVCLA